MKKAGIAGVFAGVAALVIFAISAMQSSRDGMAAPALTGQMQNFDLHETPRQVPPIAFRNEKGEAVHLSDFRGRVVLLNFWATWCPPCVREMPSLDRLQARLGGEDFVVAPLSQDREGEAVVAAFYARLDLAHLGIYLDPEMVAAGALGVVGLPTSVLIDREGREVGRLQGAAEWDSPEAIALIRHYIDERTSTALSTRAADRR